VILSRRILEFSKEAIENLTWRLLQNLTEEAI